MSSGNTQSFLHNDLAVRKLHVIGSKPCPAQECVIAGAICNAELILSGLTNAGRQAETDRFLP